MQFMLSTSFFCWGRVLAEKEKRRKFSKGKQSFRKTAVLVLESRVVYVSMADYISGKSFRGRPRVNEKRRAEENLFVLIHSECMREVCI